MGKEFQKRVIDYTVKHNLILDFEGRNNNYDLVVTCSDLVIQDNIKNKNIILVQEGMTDPANVVYHIVKYLKLPRYLASTSTTGLSGRYKVFCVASHGYRNHFEAKGVKAEKIVVSGIPNFDNVNKYKHNNFPYRNYVLAATSDARETYKYENRKKFILNSLKIADGRQLIFKLHPNENKRRAIREINKYAPGALVFENGNTNHMVANCNTLITKYSSVVYIGIALGKKVYSDFDVEELRQMTPLQNNGNSSRNIAEVCRFVINNTPFDAEQLSLKYAGAPSGSGEYYDVQDEQIINAVSNA
jgi:hypothetical protein